MHIVEKCIYNVLFPPSLPFWCLLSNERDQQLSLATNYYYNCDNYYEGKVRAPCGSKTGRPNLDRMLWKFVFSG